MHSIPSDIKDFLDLKVKQYNNPSFIDLDPISIPHRYHLKEDIEIAGFLVATIAWGNRKMIVKNGLRMMEIMGDSPYDFVMHYHESQLDRFDHFVHRTFNSIDIKYFMAALRNIYSNHGGLENVFTKASTPDSTQPAIHEFRRVFFSLPHQARTTRHISDPASGSCAKRINMFLRWMVRNDKCGVDFGICKSITASILSCPLDLHSGNVARKLGLVTRTQNDARALAELDFHLRQMDSADPVRYDFALFGLGVFEKF